MRITTTILYATLLVFFTTTVAFTSAEELQVSPELKLIHALGCKGCHIIGGSGGTIASNLNQVGSRLTTKQIDIHLNAQRKSDTKLMPSYISLSAEERQQIGNFLYNLDYK